MEGLESAVLDFIFRSFDIMGWPGVIALMAIESANIPLPSELVMPITGWVLVQDKGLGAQYVFLAGFYGALGNVVGSLASYWVGAKGGRPLLERYGKYVLISRHDLDRADGWFRKYGDWTIFFSRLLPVVRTFISFPAGIARMNLAKFILYTFLGSFPWSLGLAYGGFLLGENWDQLRSAMRPFDIPIIVAILALVGFFVWHRIRQQRRESWERQGSVGRDDQG